MKHKYNLDSDRSHAIAFTYIFNTFLPSMNTSSPKLLSSSVAHTSSLTVTTCPILVLTLFCLVSDFALPRVLVVYLPTNFVSIFLINLFDTYFYPSYFISFFSFFIYYLFFFFLFYIFFNIS